jgi:predicted permease
VFETWLFEVQYALRRLTLTPVFAITAALSLAIGIGANTAVFSLGSSLLLRPIVGVSNQARLVDVGRTQNGSGFDTASYPNYLDIRERSRTLEGIYAYEIEPTPMALGSMEGDADRIYGTVVSGNFFDVLGVRPEKGRMLQAADDRAGDSPVAVISHKLWQQQFGGSTGVTGRTILLNGQPVMVVGIAPEGFTGTTVLNADIWLPISAMQVAMPRRHADILRERQGAWLMMGAKLAPGIEIEQANAELSAIGAALEKDFPAENKGRNYRAVAISRFPGRAGVVAGFIGLLIVIVGLVLLIACVNLVGLLLARAAEREHEIAVRLALGVTRSRLFLQFLTETMMIFLLGGAAGLLLHRWLLQLLLSVVPQLPVPIMVKPVTDWRVIAFAAGLTLVAALLSGLAPALQSSKTELMTRLKSSGRDASPVKMRTRDFFLVGQITASLLLAIVGGLFVRAVTRAAKVDPGFEQKGVEVVSLDLSLGGYNESTGENFLRQVMERVKEVPGVGAVSASADLPLDGGRMGFGGLKVPGVPPPAGMDSWAADATAVEPGLFSALKWKLARGRDFSLQDARNSEAVVIVNEVLANRIWPHADAIGKQLELENGIDGKPKLMTVIGVASDARLMSLNEPAEPYYMMPLSQFYVPRVSLVVKSHEGMSAIPQIREIVRSLNARMPVTEAMPLSQITALELIPQQMAAAVAGSLGIVGLLLAGIGIFGVTASMVNRRRREIAIRMAIGANHEQVVRHMLRHSLMLTGIGLGLGAALAFSGSHLLESYLFGLSGLDPLTYFVACLLFGSVTVLASYIPARRAAAVDPMVVLRAD